MNIILFETRDEASHLSADDPRADHIRKVLKMGEGDKLFIGVIDGPRGKAEITKDDESGIQLDITWDDVIPRLFPLTLWVGLSRPQTCRKILQECTALGAQEICFFQSEKGEIGYADSKLWKTDEWRKLIVLGAEQAFNTRLPEIRHFSSLQNCIEASNEKGSRIALDLYEATETFNSIHPKESCTLAIGPERGWSNSERELLRDAHFTLANMNDRVLRTETACIAGSAVILSRMET